MPDQAEMGADATGVSTAAPPSIAATVFLYGNLFAVQVAAGVRGMRAFASGAVVATDALAQMMIAVSLANLHTSGVGHLSQYSKKRFGMLTSTGVTLTASGDLAGHRLNAPLARVLAAEKKLSTEGASVQTLTNRAVPTSKTPYEAVIKWGIDEAVELGYLDRVTEGGVLGLGAKHSLNPHAERIAGLAADARELTDVWRQFRDADADLAKQLRLVIGKGIEASKRAERESFDEDD